MQRTRIDLKVQFHEGNKATCSVDEICGWRGGVQCGGDTQILSLARQRKCRQETSCLRHRLCSEAEICHTGKATITGAFTWWDSPGLGTYDTGPWKAQEILIQMMLVSWSQPVGRYSVVTNDSVNINSSWRKESFSSLPQAQKGPKRC